MSIIKDFGTKEEHTSQQKQSGNISSPGSLDKNTMSALESAGNNVNKITVNYTDGTSEKLEGFIKDGVTYTKDPATGEGKRVVDGGDGSGLFTKDKMVDIDGYNVSGSSSHTYETVIVIDKPKVVTQPTSVKSHTPEPREEREEREPVYYSPPKPNAPSKPALITYNSPNPPVSSNLQKVNKYSYFFGLDNFNLLYKTINPVCCFISEEIHIGIINQNEYIQLEAEFESNDFSSLEFYIVDGTMEIPIMPTNTETVFNEKIFFGLGTRFSIDESKSVEIKKDGIASNKTIDQAIQSNDGLYTITYTPINSYNYRPLNTSVKIKVIQRLYDKTFEAPFIKNLKIRKHGGTALWKEDISIL